MTKVYKITIYCDDLQQQPGVLTTVEIQGNSVKEAITKLKKTLRFEATEIKKND